MFKYVVPIILIGVSVVGFLMYTKPLLGDISNIKNAIVNYDDALNNAKALENERDKLTKKYNSIDPDDLIRLEKFLPNGIDNVRLILEIEKIAAPYGMTLSGVSYDDTPKNTTVPSVENTTVKKIDSNKYGTWNLSFSTMGTYQNFLSFMKDLENNLRMVDIASIKFSSDTSTSLGKIKAVESYKYDFQIKTYWLKN